MEDKTMGIMTTLTKNLPQKARPPPRALRPPRRSGPAVRWSVAQRASGWVLDRRRRLG